MLKLIFSPLNSMQWTSKPLITLETFSFIENDTSFMLIIYLVENTYLFVFIHHDWIFHKRVRPISPP